VRSPFAFSLLTLSLASPHASFRVQGFRTLPLIAPFFSHWRHDHSPSSSLPALPRPRVSQSVRAPLSRRAVASLCITPLPPKIFASLSSGFRCRMTERSSSQMPRPTGAFFAVLRLLLPFFFVPAGRFYSTFRRESRITRTSLDSPPHKRENPFALLFNTLSARPLFFFSEPRIFPPCALDRRLFFHRLP